MKPLFTTHILNAICLALATLSLACGAASQSVASQPTLDGVWEGQVELLVLRKRILIHFANERGTLRAKMDVPTSLAQGFPLRDVAVKDGMLHFSIPLGAGLRLEPEAWQHLPLLVPGNAGEEKTLMFAGRIDGDSIHGKTAGVPFPGTFSLRRSRAPNPAPPSFAEWRPQKRDYWPTKEWKTTTPAAESIDPNGLAAAERVIQAEKPEVRSLLIVRNGRLVYEQYFRGASATQTFNVKSVTKSFTSALTGIALRQGLLRNLDEKVSSMLPEYFGSLNDARKQQITLRHLLTMTAGFAWTENGTVTAEWMRSDDPAKFLLNLPLAADPGKGYTYNTGVSHLLSVILTRQSKMSLRDFAQRHLFTPLGISSGRDAPRWDTDAQGVCEGGSELHLTARDMARFGFLYLNAGQWEGKEIVPADWVRESLRPRSSKDPLQADYGYQWWIGQDDELPAFSAFGYGGQLIHIVPKLDLVVVSTSTINDPNNDVLLTVLEHILPAVRARVGQQRPTK